MYKSGDDVLVIPSLLLAETYVCFRVPALGFFSCYITTYICGSFSASSLGYRASTSMNYRYRELLLILW
jgi:hypothetical protein